MAKKGKGKGKGKVEIKEGSVQASQPPKDTDKTNSTVVDQSKKEPTPPPPVKKSPFTYIYSENFEDDEGYQYRTVTRNETISYYDFNKMPHVLTEIQWREMGIQQGHHWEHFGNSKQDRQVFLFRRKKELDPKYKPPSESTE